MEQGTHNKITAATSVFAVLAAIASAASAFFLYSLEITEREFIQRNNATAAVRDWQINTANNAKSGFKCLLYFNNLIDQPALFEKAWEKKEYELEGKAKQEMLKACLDRENRIELSALNTALSATTYVPTSIKVTQDVSKFIGSQAIDYLNFTEALFMPWKYNTAEKCIIIEQLGVPTSEYLRNVVTKQYELFPATYKFLMEYATTNEVRAEMQNCKSAGLI